MYTPQSPELSGPRSQMTEDRPASAPAALFGQDAERENLRDWSQPTQIETPTVPMQEIRVPGEAGMSDTNDELSPASPQQDEMTEETLARLTLTDEELLDEVGTLTRGLRAAGDPRAASIFNEAERIR